MIVTQRTITINKYQVIRGRTFNLFTTILAVILIIKFVVLLYRPVSADELWTLYIIKNDIATIIRGSFADFRPPLYYLLLIPWTYLFGDSIIVLRFFSLLCSMLALVCLYKCARYISTKKNALTLLLLTGISAGLVYDAGDARMFALSTLASTLLIWTVLIYLRTRKTSDLVLVFLSLLLGVYIYHYMWLFIPSVFWIVYSHHPINKRMFFVCVVLFILACLPLFYFISAEYSLLGNFHSDLSGNIFKIFFSLIAPFFPSEMFLVTTGELRPYLLISALLFFILPCIGHMLHAKTILKHLFFYFLIVPSLILIISSVLIRPLIGIHSLIIFSPVLLLALLPALLRFPFLKFILFFLVTSTSIYYFHNFNRLQTDLSAYQFVNMNLSTEVDVLVDDLYPFLWARYELKNKLPKGIVQSSFNSLTEKSLGYIVLDDHALKTRKVFFLSTNKSKNQSENNSNKIIQQGYSIVTRQQFSNVTLIMYQKR